MNDDDLEFANIEVKLHKNLLEVAGQLRNIRVSIENIATPFGFKQTIKDLEMLQLYIEKSISSDLSIKIKQLKGEN